MDEKRCEFLSTMIGILTRLHDASIQHDEPLLAKMLLIARGEADDALRHAGELEELAARRAAQSSAHSWRASDQYDEVGSMAAAAVEAALAEDALAADANRIAA